MQKGVGTYKVEQRPEVSPQPYRHRWDEVGKLPSVGYPHTMLGALKPNLEGVPGCEVRGSFARFLGQSCHDCPSLLLSVCDGKGEKSGFVLWMELDGSGRDYQPGRSFPLDEAGLYALRGLLHGLVADAPFGEKRAHEVGGELPAHSGCFVDDQEAMLYGLLQVGEGAFAHGRKCVVGTLRDEGEHPLHHMALAARRWTFEGDADRPLQQTRCHREVQQLGYPRFSSDARAGKRFSEAP